MKQLRMECYREFGLESTFWSLFLPAGPIVPLIIRCSVIDRMMAHVRLSLNEELERGGRRFS